MNRRGFLRFLGLAPVGIPAGALVATSAADAHALTLPFPADLSECGAIMARGMRAGHKACVQCGYVNMRLIPGETVDVRNTFTGSVDIRRLIRDFESSRRKDMEVIYDRTWKRISQLKDQIKNIDRGDAPLAPDDGRSRGITPAGPTGPFLPDVSSEAEQEDDYERA